MSHSSVALAGAGIQFSCSKSQGAVLFLRRRAIREDTCSRMDFKDYILQNYRSWYHFANDRLRRGVKSGQIMLVTGCDKTAEWASAVFADRNRSAGITFSGKPDIVYTCFKPESIFTYKIYRRCAYNCLRRANNIWKLGI